MKRILEESPVTGYQLFRYAKVQADGSTVVLPNFYIRHKGKETCTGTDRLKDAKTAVKKQAGADANQRWRTAARPADVTVGQLLDLVVENYIRNDRKTVREAKNRINRGLRPFFQDMVASKVHTDKIEEWIAWRASHRIYRSVKHKHEDLQPASINRELSLLHRGYQLGLERNPQLVDKIPPIKKLPENNVRKGFVTLEQYEQLKKELPAHLKPITCVAFNVANRKGELFNVEWSDVELDGNPPVLTLWANETKNGEGRTLPILPEMMTELRALMAEHLEKWPQQTHVFLTPDGKPLRYHHMRDDWDNACTRAGLHGLLFHDLRRSAVRNLRRAGVTQTVARQFSGHKTDSVFNRYNITDFEDLREAAGKLSKYLGNK